MFIEKEIDLDWKENYFYYKISKIFNEDCYFFIKKDVEYYLFLKIHYSYLLISADTLQECYDYADSYSRDILCL